MKNTLTPEQKAARNENLGKARAARKAQHDAQLGSDDVDTDESQLLQIRTDPQVAHAVAQAQGGVMQRQIEEVPTGRTIRVQKCVGYKMSGYRDDGREIVKPVMKWCSLPTYYYKVDMPPCGGNDLKINGTPYYHGAVYEFDSDTLRTVKEMIFRLWKHDADIHGSDENFYRSPSRPSISARGAR